MASTFQAGRRRKAELTIFTDKSGSDTSQVVSVGATANVYLAGATVRTATGSPAVGAGQTIPISDPGMIKIGDVLQNGTAAAPTLTVTAVNRVQAGLKYTWTLTATASASFSFLADDRLINTSRRPTIYKDPGDDISWGGTSTTSTAAGLVRFYTMSRAVDVIVSGGTPSVTSTIVRDVVCEDTGLQLNVQDFGGSIKQALAYLATQPGPGGVIRVPQGFYIYDTADIDIAVTGNVTIRGDGRIATTILVESTAGNNNLNLFNVTGSKVIIEDMRIIGRSGVSGTGVGIRVGYTDTSTTTQHVTLRNLDIFDWSSYGIEVGRRLDSTLWGIDFLQIDNCRLGGSQSNAQLRIGSGSTMIRVSSTGIGPVGSSSTSPTGVLGIHIAGAHNVTFENCDGNPADLNTKFFYAEPYNSFANPKDGGGNLVIDNCDFEGATVPAAETTPLIHIWGFSAPVVRNCLLFQAGSGVLFDKCYAPVSDANAFKGIGSSGYELRFTDCFYPQDRGSCTENLDAAPDHGARKPVTISTTGVNPGLSVIGPGLRIPTYATDAERDTAPAAGSDDKRASTAAGTMIYVVTPTAPTSHLQIRQGGAWIGIGSQAGVAI